VIRRVVVGTAGHVDHGKTALVRALTGVDCDRLPEEKRRGISIELGFAEWRVSDDLRASVVDVPGHEAFVRTMIAGAHGIDGVVLVIAADDGVMPQTREHLEVCNLLGAVRGVVALTKRDRADDARLAEVHAEARALVRGTFLEGAEIVPCCALDGRGLAEIRAAVARWEPSARPTAGPAWMPIDRVFTLAGAGTVVTGTLVRGVLRSGEAVEVLPVDGGVARATMRTLQVHGAPVDEARAPARVAVAIRHERRVAIDRGAVLATPGAQRPTRALVVRVTVVGDLAPRGEVTVHAGAAKVAGVARVLERDGQEALVRIALARPLATYPDDRVVLRRPDLPARRTVAGGHVVDPHPRGRSARAIAAAQTLDDRVLALVDAGADRDELARRTSWGSGWEAAVERLVRSGVLRDLEGTLVRAGRVEAAADAIVARLAERHADRPERSGVPLAEVATDVAARAALEGLGASGRVVIDGGFARLPDHGAAASPLAAQIARELARAGLAPPSEGEVLRAVGAEARAFRDALDDLKRRGRVHAIGGHLFDAAAVRDLETRVRAHFAGSPELRPADLKALCGGLSRKYAIPLLEWLDRQGVTRRVGERRVAGPRRD
jgi:selenocysteine-specific elongation factor